jgi:hypothetical protein
MRTRGQGAAFRFHTGAPERDRQLRDVHACAGLPVTASCGEDVVRIDLSKQAASLGVDLTSLLSASQSFAPLQKGLV